LDSFDGLLDIKSKGAGNSGGLSAAIFWLEFWRVFFNYRRWCMIFNSLEFFAEDLCQPASLVEANVVNSRNSTLDSFSQPSVRSNRGGL
jgi:hypothetical protein